MKFPSIDELQNDLSNTRARSIMRETGWHRRPIIRFGACEYVILHHIYPRPGAMRVDVINVSEFDSDSPFQIFRLKPEPWGDRQEAYVIFTEEGIGVLTTYNDEPAEFPHPSTAVLTFRIEPPTRDDICATEDQLDDELQQGFEWPIL